MGSWEVGSWEDWLMVVCITCWISVPFIFLPWYGKSHATPQITEKWDQKRLISAHFWPQNWWFCTKMHVFESKNASWLSQFFKDTCHHARSERPRSVMVVQLSQLCHQGAVQLDPFLQFSPCRVCAKHRKIKLREFRAPVFTYSVFHTAKVQKNERNTKFFTQKAFIIHTESTESTEIFQPIRLLFYCPAEIAEMAEIFLFG